MMTAMFQHPNAQALAWALVHFLWQGAVIGLATYAIFRFSRLSATGRYLAGVLSLVAMVAAPVVTFVFLTNAPAPRAIATSVDAAPQISVVTTIAPSAALPALGTPNSFALAPSVVVALWLAGVTFFSVRLLGGWVVTRRLVRVSVQPAHPELQVLVRRVAGRLALDRIVHVFESTAVAVPVMVGWIKPVVLVPAAALSGLSPTQVEALIAHELAHVRRNDYLVNLLQSMVETLLFYHPAVWWVSRQVRTEREHCCDDLALGVCDRLVYVTALADLAAMSSGPRLALAASDGSLVRRVRRILLQTDDAGRGSSWMAALLVVLAGAVFAPGLVAHVFDSAAAAPQGASAIDDQRVAGGVVGGVQGGVAPGVVGGVSAGVAGGVAGDIPGGAGVPGGVVGGVTGGVVGNVAGTAQKAAAEKLEQAEDLKARLTAYQELLAKLNEQQKTLETERIRARAELDLKELAAQMEALKADLQRIKRKVEVGMEDPAAVVASEREIAAVARKIEARKAELDYQTKVSVMQRDADQLRAQYERVARDYTERVAQSEAVGADVEAARRRAEERGVRRLEVAPEVESSAVESSAPIIAADILTIEISGEPDLPRAYVVRSDGTIRLPLVGLIRAQGLTARQLEDAIVKLFNVHGIKADVRTSVRRPRR